MLDHFDLLEKARSEASKTAPPPRFTPIAGGILFAFFATFVCVVFAGFVGLDKESRKFSQAASWTAILFGLASYLVIRLQQRSHDKATDKHWKQLVEKHKRQQQLVARQNPKRHPGSATNQTNPENNQ